MSVDPVSRQKNYSRHFPARVRDLKWGWCVTTADELRILPGQACPPSGHPNGYNFQWTGGRVLNTQKAKIRDESTRLSVREEQILLLLSQGHSNKMIVAKLGLSIDTVCTPLKHVLNKLHVNSLTKAVVQ